MKKITDDFDLMNEFGPGWGQNIKEEVSNNRGSPLLLTQFQKSGVVSQDPSSNDAAPSQKKDALDQSKNTAYSRARKMAPGSKLIPRHIRAQINALAHKRALQFEDEMSFEFHQRAVRLTKEGKSLREICLSLGLNYD